MYSGYLFLISSASVRSLPFLSFILPIFEWYVPLKVKVKLLSHVWLFATPWTVTYQAPLIMGFSRQECWSGLPFPSPGYLPDPGIESRSSALQADGLPSEPPGVSLIFLKIYLMFSILLFSSVSLNCSLKKTFLSLLAILWNSAFIWVYFSFSPLPRASLLSYL